MKKVVCFLGLMLNLYLLQVIKAQGGNDFLKSHLSQIQDYLLASLSKASPPSQASRLRCLTSIVRNLDENQEQFVYKVIPEAILCVKAANEKARSGSFTILIVIGEVNCMYNLIEKLQNLLIFDALVRKLQNVF